MKKSIKTFVILMAISFTFCSASFAQKKFRGILTVSYSYTGMDAATIAQLPKSKTLMVYDNLSKEQTNYGPVLMEQILNGDAKTISILLDQMGDKKYLKFTTEESKQLADKVTDIKIIYTEETKSIAGYTCKKAIVTSKNEDGITISDTVFYSEELGNEALNWGSKFEGLKGMPMQYKVTQDELVITVMVTEVKKGKVKDTDFLIPSDYVEFSAEEKQQMIDQFKGKE